MHEEDEKGQAMKTIESIFNLFLIMTAFIAYFFGHLHIAFWFAIAWACYLFVAIVFYARIGEQLKKMEKDVNVLLKR